MTNKQMDNQLICIGCGAALQTEEESKPGYVTQSVMERAHEGEDIYCKRCFRLRHYNEVQDVGMQDDDFLNMLHELTQKNALIVNVVDVFDFNGSVISGMQRFAGNNPVLVVANKVDLLPKTLKEGKTRQWIAEQAHALGIRPVDIRLISALDKKSVEQFMVELEKRRKGKDVYIVGTTNVGKSTLVNQIISISTESDDMITTSYFPGTTLGKIEIPLDDEKVIVDTPGIVQSTQLSHYLTPKELKVITPKKAIKPKTYQLDEEQTLFFGGLARFDYLSGDGQQTFVSYLSNEVPIHRTKLENADDLYERQVGDLLTPPYKESASSLPELKRFEFNIKEPSDIVFSGLGWVSVDQGQTKVAGWAPKGVEVAIRKKLI